MPPWYRRSGRRAPRGNPQLEAGLDRLRAFIMDPTNRRRVRDNLSPDLREAMVQLRNLPVTHGAQVVFEDKGNRFVVRDLANQDGQILEQLEQRGKFDELLLDPKDRVVERLEEFTQRWEEELNTFHPNIIHFILDVQESNPSKVKGLVKVHKEVREDGKHPIRLLLASCGTPTNPASKLLQASISHIIPHLRSNMRDTAAILRKIKRINEEHPEGLPEATINLGCDVEAMYPSIDQEFGLEALEEHLGRHPNPDGLPTALIMDLARICLAENTCEFLQRFFNPNSGTATGPPHACEFCDIAMAPLDARVEEELEEREVEHTGWTRYRDDGWMVLPGGMADVPVVEDILQSLHPNIRWTVNPRGPTAPPLVRRDGVQVDTSVLEHLDLTIHLVEGRLETDLYAKDIPIYISRRSCHPPAVFKSVAKAVATRLRLNCSLERFYSPRVEEYTRYLLASDYTREEVAAAMEDARRKSREELLEEPRRERRRGGRKYAMVTRYDPRAPNIGQGLKLLEEILHQNPDNTRVFPRGSIVAGFRRGRNLGETIAPTRPLRERREVEVGGSVHCTSGRCLLHRDGALREVRSIRSRRDGQEWRLPRRVACDSRDVVYYILCPCTNPTDYVGSTAEMRRRWSGHKSDMRQGRWEACGLTRHFAEHHQANLEEAISHLQVVLLDRIVGPHSEDRLVELEQRWMHRLGTTEVGCNSRVELTGRGRRNWGTS